MSSRLFCTQLRTTSWSFCASEGPDSMAAQSAILWASLRELWVQGGATLGCLAVMTSVVAARKLCNTLPGL